IAEPATILPLTSSLHDALPIYQVTWGTLLDSIIRFAGRTFDLDKEYVAGWFSSMYPAVHLTPCVDIHCVPPSSCVLLRPGSHTVDRKSTRLNSSHGTTSYALFG